MVLVPNTKTETGPSYTSVKQRLVKELAVKTNNNNNKGSMDMGEVVPFKGVDPALVLTSLGVQQCNLRHQPLTSLHTRPSLRSE